MKTICAIILLSVSIFGDDKPKKYEATEVEQLKLQLKQKDVQIAQIYFQNSLQELYKECTQIRNQHKWPETVTCDSNTLKFMDSAQGETNGNKGKDEKK